MKRDDLVRYLDHYLRIGQIEDYGPQGLQVEGGEEVTRIAFTVDAAMPCIEAAVKMGAQMQIVHHGLLWGKAEPIRGPLGRKIRRLLRNDINLYAAHLALDAHPEVGNNVELARLLDLTVDSWFHTVNGIDIGVVCNAGEDLTVSDLAATLKALLGVDPKVLAHGPEEISRVAIISGHGIGGAAEAASMGADTFITGETSHAHYYNALDYGLNVLFAGHYASETVGLKALGRHLNGRFGLETVFYDLPTGM
jgi:dinuclear metal center YbgI/SA1388 family protein